MSNDPYAAPSANLDNSANATTIQTSTWSAKGRLSVLSYLGQLFAAMLVFFLVLGVLGFLGSMLMGGPAGISSVVEGGDFSNPVLIVLGLVGIVLLIAFIYVTVCMMIKRLHDRNHSGWWSLLVFVGSFIPFVNLVVFIGSLYIMFWPGHKHANRFGAPRTTRGWEKVLGILYILFIVAAIVAGIAGGAAMMTGMPDLPGLPTG